MSRGSEHKEKREFCDWIMKNSSRVERLFWEQKNDFYDVFSIKGVNGEKPDLLIITNSDDLGNLAVEFKTGFDSSSVYDSLPQIHRYQKSYEEGKQSYFVDGETVCVDNFVLANRNSKEGLLFKKSREFLRGPEDGQGRKWSVRKGNIPSYEYNRTEAVTRVLMRYSTEFIDSKSGVGVILSDSLDSDPRQRDFSVSCPKLLFYSGDGWNWVSL